jgi:hypothetical protein
MRTFWTKVEEVVEEIARSNDLDVVTLSNIRGEYGWVFQRGRGSLANVAALYYTVSGDVGYFTWLVVGREPKQAKVHLLAALELEAFFAVVRSDFGREEPLFVEGVVS